MADGNIKSTRSRLSEMDTFTEQIQHASLDQLRIYSKTPDIVATPADYALLPFFQHMAQILVSGADIDVVIKTHFMTLAAESLLMRKTGSILSNSHTIDFMKEFSNLLAGKTKAMLEESGFVVAQSLPFAIRGYNEIFYKVRLENSNQRVWSLKWNGSDIQCSVNITLKTHRDFTPLGTIQYNVQNQDDVGEVEIF